MISIITASYNAERTISDCVNSLKAQTESVEHIVIDGVSTDGTLVLLEEIGLDGMQLYSENDEGMYEAMNKGIKRANGDVIGLLNADDFYDSPLVLEAVSEVFDKEDVDACYGDLIYVDRNNTDKLCRYWRAGGYKRSKFLWGWMPPHPTFFVRKEVYERFGDFNLEMGSAADYELMLRFLFKEKLKTKYIPFTMVRMRTGGVSNRSLKNRLRANRMDRKAWEVNNVKPYPWTIWLKPLRKIPQWFLR